MCASRFTAREIVSTLSGFGLSSRWDNTGGNVYNVTVPIAYDDGGVYAWVAISANGEWTGDDYDEPTGSVSVALFDDYMDTYGLRAWFAVVPDSAAISGSDYVECSSVASVASVVRQAVAHARMSDRADD